MLVCHKHLEKYGFNVCHDCHIFLSEFPLSDWWDQDQATTFYSQKPHNTLHYSQRQHKFCQFYRDDGPMMRNEPSFALLICLWIWLFSITLLDHIFHKNSVILMVLFILDRPFLEIFQSQFSHLPVLYCILFPLLAILSRYFHLLIFSGVATSSSPTGSNAQNMRICMGERDSA